MTSSTAQLVAMRWWHIAEVVALEQQLFPVDAWTTEQFWAELAQPTRHYFLAVEGDAVLGYAGLFALAPEADVQTIAVSPRAQGRGIGRLLLEELIDQALARNCTQLVLEVERMSIRRDYYAQGVDALIMRLRPLTSRTAR